MTYQLAHQELFIVNEASETGNAYLYNISGQLLEVITVGPESKESMPSWTSLAQGIYIIELTSVNGQKQAHKIAK
jgi:TusA-related sulfurtransferase